MLLLGVEPDAVTMNLLIKAAASDGRLDKAEELYRQMRVLGPPPTSVTYVHMFQAFQGSRSKDPARILQVAPLSLFLGAFAASRIHASPHLPYHAGTCTSRAAASCVAQMLCMSQEMLPCPPVKLHQQNSKALQIPTSLDAWGRLHPSNTFLLCTTFLLGRRP